MRVALAAAALFVLLGFLLIPYAGIEDDEAFFTTAIYGPLNPHFRIVVFHHTIPLMIWPYAGALKAWLYRPVLAVFGPSAWSFRGPVVLAGAVTILLLFRFASRLANRRAAVFACLLLATDPSFLLTNTYDWGPVAMEHLLLMAGCVLFVSRRPVWGSFVFGLALWNKAVFVWALAGLTAAVVAAYLPELRRFLSDRRAIALSLCAFLLGATPLIIFNIHFPNATPRANIHPSTSEFATKLVSARATLDGSALFGVVVEQEWSEKPKAPVSIAGRLAAFVRERTGRHYRSLFVYALAASLLAVPLWWRTKLRRGALFAAVFSIVAFLTMAFVRYTGAAHHVVLIYPMPQLLAGIVLASLTSTRIAKTLAAVLVVANLLVVNQYLVQFERNGAGRLFTDASYRLADTFRDSEKSTIYVLDWNIEVGLSLLHRGTLKIHPVWPVMTSPFVESQRNDVEQMLHDPSAICVARVSSLEQPPDAGDRVVALAGSFGYRKQLIQTIPDSNGRPRFELFQFVH